MTGDLLTVEAVLARYHLKDRRAARRLMDDVGAFLIAGNLYVRAADLLAHEDRQKAERAARNAPTGRHDRNPRRARRPAGESGALGPGWWELPK